MLNKIMGIFSSGMAIIYLLIGLFILFRINLMDIPTWQRITAGGLVTGYGIFRVTRGILNYKNSKDDDK